MDACITFHGPLGNASKAMMSHSYGAAVLQVAERPCLRPSSGFLIGGLVAVVRVQVYFTETFSV